ncbi:3-isopropylmalate dehydrogenase [Sporomusa sp.]|jgi:3-isopropylmalate dehydrogenase|uniref:3-isopropylmalate dehydrogenase n=1 Tax=Sporomusa sp. TaxID=2078658 RepID=UPI002BC7AE41|nr:3-isopropylmalate dehydrogenase [Sporomusa sp.]HWR08085.1 3-isopropylmalate dehydrogenase [Sporomusa sp.]
MSSKNIVVIPGDGIGAEITTAALSVAQAAADKCHISFTYETKQAGGAAIDAYGVPLPEDTITACRRADGVLLGAVGGPKWDNVAPELRAEKAILGLRKELGLYANLRPIKVFPALAGQSPLKPEIVSSVDILIVRELNGGIYYGARQEATVINGVEQACDNEIYSRPEVERIVRLACRAAIGRKGKLMSVDKANVLATSRLWRKVAAEVVQDFEQVQLNHMYVDNCAMQLVLNPGSFDVIVTSNLFGDILSDEAAVLSGSIGLLPSASLGDGTGLYEPIHGSAPDIAGQGLANPLGTILSAAMLFRYSLSSEQAAAMIDQAVEQVLNDGYRTADIYQPGFTKVSTEEMGRQVIARLR